MPPSSPSMSRRAVGLLLDIAIVLLALFGVHQALAGSPLAGLWVGLGLGLLGLVLLQGEQVEPAVPGPLGTAAVPRGSLAVATAVCVASAGEWATGHALLAAFGGAVLVGFIVVEPFVARAARFVVPTAVRLPGVPSRRSRPDLGPLAVVASVVACAAGLLLAAAGQHAAWWVLTCLLAVTPVVAVAADGRAKISFARRRWTALGPALVDYAPDFLVFTAGPDNGSHQVMMWLPYLQRSGLRFVIVSHSAVPAAILAGQTAVPVIEVRGIADLERVLVPSLKAAFYVNASSGNGTLVRFRSLTHVFLGHGDSDKPTSYNPTHAMYDQIFAAGPAATRRYAAHGVRIPAEKFRVVGRPQVEAVLPAERPIAEVAQPTVLYAPTWRGHVEETLLYSLPRGEEIVDALLARGVRVIFRPHPFSYEFSEDAAVIGRIQARLDGDLRRTGRQHLWGAAAEKDTGRVGLHERLRRHGLRRVECGVGLSVLR